MRATLVFPRASGASTASTESSSDVFARLNTLVSILTRTPQLKAADSISTRASTVYPTLTRYSYVWTNDVGSTWFVTPLRRLCFFPIVGWTTTATARITGYPISKKRSKRNMNRKRLPRNETEALNQSKKETKENRPKLRGRLPGKRCSRRREGGWATLLWSTGSTFLWRLFKILP